MQLTKHALLKAGYWGPSDLEPPAGDDSERSIHSLKDTNVNLQTPMIWEARMNELNASEKRQLANYETVIAEHKESFVKAGTALLAIRDNRLYLGEHKHFADYCKKRWDFGTSRVKQLISACEVRQLVATMVEVNCPSYDLSSQMNERQLRELAGLEENQAADVLSKAVAESPKDSEGNPKLTAKRLREAKQAVLGDKPDEDVVDGECEPHLEFWEEAAAKHADALNALTKIKSLMESIVKTEQGEYLTHVIVRVRNDIKGLRATIRQNTPVGMNGEGVLTRGEQEARKR